MLKGKYNLTIEVTDEETDWPVYREDIRNINPGDIIALTRYAERAIEEYDKDAYKDCDCCGKTTHIDCLSEPDDEDTNTAYCQNCLEKIMSGEIKVEEK